MDGPRSVGDVFEKFNIGDRPDAAATDSIDDSTVFDEAAFDAIMNEAKSQNAEDILPSGPVNEVIPASQAADEPKPPTENKPEPCDDLTARKFLSGLDVLQASITQLDQGVNTIAETSGKTANEIREMHKLYHNEFANRLKSMQDELEQYREIDKGRIFDDILGDIAKLYSDNESVVEDIADDKLKKRVRYMFMDILQILEANGVEKLKSNPGDKRNTRHCQIVERIPTSDHALHDTIAQSRGTGFFVENRSLVKEFVDVYLYKEPDTDVSAENQGGNSL